MYFVKILFIASIAILPHESFCDFRGYLQQAFVSTLAELDNYASDQKLSIATEPINTVSLPFYAVSANIFNLFSSSYVLLNSTLYTLEKNSENFLFKQRRSLGDENQEVLFVEITEYDKTGIIFIALSNVSSVIYGYSSSKNEWFYIQTISNQTPSAAKFFKNQNDLYLIITSNKSKVYKWTNLYFYQVEKIATQEVVGLTSFTDHKFEIITLLKNSTSYVNPHAPIFKFSKDGLRKVQLLAVNSPSYVLTYKFKDHFYMVVFEKFQNSKLYFWNGFEFILWDEFGNFVYVDRALVTYVKQKPVLFILQKSKIFVFTHFSKRLNLIRTIELKDSFEKISNMEIVSFNNKLFLFLVTLNNAKINYVTTEFIIGFSKIPDTPSQENQLVKCLNTLENSLLNKGQKTDSVIEIEKSSLQINEPPQHNYSSVNEPVLQQQVPVNLVSDTTTGIIQQHVTKLLHEISHLKKRISDLTPKLETLYHHGDMIHGNLKVNGDLKGAQLLSDDLQIEYLNNVRWTPNSWLSHTKPQTVMGPVIFQSLNSQNLLVSNDNKLYKDLLRRNYMNEDKIITINSVTADSIFAKDINNVPIKDLYLKSSPVTISGFKNFQRLSVASMRATYLNEKNATNVMERQRTEITQNLKTKNLTFKKINGLDWDIFKNSLFCKGNSLRITGNLKAKNVESNHIFANSIANISSESLMTTTTNQTITSSIKFEVISVGHVKCNTFNQINFDKEVATEKNSHIKGPVSFDHLTVVGVMSRPAFNNSKSLIDEVNEEHFFQLYKNVKIIGNLYLSNIKLKNKARAIVSGLEFKQSDISNYWLKNENQVISNHFEAQEGITVPHLMTSFLNNNHVKQYLRNEPENSIATNLFFENATILGNVALNPLVNHKRDLKKIISEAVKTKGNFTIYNQKMLQGEITVGNLVTNYLDEIKIVDAITVHNFNKISGTKMFKNVLIEGNLDSNIISANLINGVNLTLLDNLTLFANKNEVINKLFVNNITAHHIKAQQINNFTYIDYLNYFNDINRWKSLKHLIVQGNARFSNVQGISYINDIPINEFLMEKIAHDNGNTNIRTTVQFRGNVFAKNVETNFINDVDVQKLFKQLYYRNMEQNVTANHQFEIITTPNIYTPKINAVQTRNLINVNERKLQKLIVPGGIKLVEPEFLGSLYSGSLDCNVVQAVDQIQNSPTRFWNSFVTQNVTLWDENCDFANILDNSVNLGKKNVIRGQITFDHTVLGKTVSLNHVNGINFSELLSDAVLSSATEQIIAGHKVFDNLITSHAVVYGNAEIPKINKIDLMQLNKSIVYKEEVGNRVINGSKIFFAGLEVNQLMSSNISYLNPNVLVTTENFTIPKALFHSLAIENNLQIDYVNYVNVDDILSKRILRNSNDEQQVLGLYYINHLLLVGNASADKINNVTVEDVVFDDEKDTVIGSKMFTQAVEALSDVSFKSLNGMDISKQYKLAMYYNESKISKNIIFNSYVHVGTNISTNYLNGVSVDQLQSLIKSKMPATYSKIIRKSIGKIESAVSEGLDMSNEAPNSYLYLEHSKDLHLELNNVVEATILEVKNQVIINTLLEEPASACGYSSECSCFIQQKIQITPEKSINYLTEVERTLFFSYEDDETTIHYFSSNNEKACQFDVDFGNDSISFSWIIRSPGETQGSYFYSDYIKGYIKRVEFYRLKGTIYAAMNVLQGNNLVCLVYKFDSKQKTVNLVQTINGKTLKLLLNTPEGLVLVTTIEEDLRVLTEIYRFNDTLETFNKFQQIISTNLPITASAVVNSKSALIFGNNNNLRIYMNINGNNFVEQTNIPIDYKIIAISPFYLGGVESRTTYLSVVSDAGGFYIYSLSTHAIISSGKIDGLRMLLPFKLNGKHYLFAVSSKVSSLLSVIQQGIH